MVNNAPYKIVKRNGKFAVVNNAGETKAIFSDEAKARDYQKALYASVPGAPKAAAKTKWTGKAKLKEAAADRTETSTYGGGDKTMTMPDGSYPIKDQKSANSAWKLRNHSKTYSAAQVKAHIARAVAKRGLKHPRTMMSESASQLLIEVRDRALEAPAAETAPDENARSESDAAPAQVLEFAGKTLITGRLQVGQVDELAEAYERAGIDNPYHLMLHGRFVQAGAANANGAYWEVADLQFGQPTVKNGPLNWLHDPARVVGTLLDSQLVAPKLEVAGTGVGTHLAVAALMWKHLHPKLAGMVEEASAARQLSFSMECTSERVKCTSGEGRIGCGAEHPLRQIMTEPASVCDHLRERSSRRWFQDPTFLGGALIVPPVKPAWREASAKVLEAATREAERTWPQGEAAGYTQQSWAELVCAAASMA